MQLSISLILSGLLASGCAICASALAADSLTPSLWVSTATKALPPVNSIARSAVPGNMPVHVVVSLKLRDKDGLKTFLHNQHTPGNPQYGITLSTAQFLAAYAPTVEQVQAVRDYLGAAGFSDITVASNRALISADATAATWA